MGIQTGICSGVKQEEEKRITTHIKMFWRIMCPPRDNEKNVSPQNIYWYLISVIVDDQMTSSCWPSREGKKCTGEWFTKWTNRNLSGEFEFLSFFFHKPTVFNWLTYKGSEDQSEDQ